MRDASELVQRYGGHLGDIQDELVERLQAPYSPQILRLIREVLTGGGNERKRVDELARAADRLGLVRQLAPEPLPPITDEDVYLIAWMAVVPA
jgi:hypothetical protein